MNPRSVGVAVNLSALPPEARGAKRGKKRLPAPIKWIRQDYTAFYEADHRCTGVKVDVPIQVISEANSGRHWREINKRKKEQQAGLTFGFTIVPRPELPVTVTLWRLYTDTGGKSHGTMDDDNLARAFKGVRDWLAKWLKVDDADPRVKWKCEQLLSGVVGVRIKIAPVRT